MSAHFAGFSLFPFASSANPSLSLASYDLQSLTLYASRLLPSSMPSVFACERINQGKLNKPSEFPRMIYRQGPYSI
ncbi:MAG: hypothetical protein KBG40_08125 [Bacteroidales bacterium]|nr:hypothetical protein [Bacteroidales bacterium]